MLQNNALDDKEMFLTNVKNQRARPGREITEDLKRYPVQKEFNGPLKQVHAEKRVQTVQQDTVEDISASVVHLKV
jgi:hypothetical protein